MPITDEKLKKFKALLEIASDSLTKEEFLQSFQKVINHTLKIEQELTAKIDNKTLVEKDKLEMLWHEFKQIVEQLKADGQEILTQSQQEFSQIIGQAKEESDNTLSGFRKRTLEAINNLFTRNEVNKKLNERLEMVNDKITEIDNRLSAIRDGVDGQDADEEHIISEVLNKVRLVEQEFDIENIKGLKKELEDLRNIRTRVVGGGTSAIGIANAAKYFIKKEAPTGAINGINKIFTVKHTIFAMLSFVINGEHVAGLPNYTVASNKITFTTAIPAAYSGKDIEVVYI